MLTLALRGWQIWPYDLVIREQMAALLAKAFLRRDYHKYLPCILGLGKLGRKFKK
jgi:hypothetical protein